MLEKVINISVIILVIIFIYLVFINKFISIFQDIKSINELSIRFYSGRILMKILTEEYSNGICNLTDEFFNLIKNESYLKEVTDSYKIEPVYTIIVENLETGDRTIVDFGNFNNFQFNRVCYYNGSLYLIKVIV